MIDVKPIEVEGYTFIAISAQLPETNLLVIQNHIGYVMCGALDIDLLNEKLKDRPIIAGRAVGVRTIDELLEGTLDKVTIHSQKYNWTPGMPIKQALLTIANE
ncbi:hypothetical protein J416_09034 [Gracilibacillus halophilus YIM-C55.5]|uniref:DUF1805 domain-containing protein n=1 Tax=Gracilibacillus halophilus YIM-C55.5 TaxID=1308866 RepID=N4WQV0_9BACI|nr:DUF1805 domain-containing protein [Gracilibacillus halophilus]ENH96830.1 hypothetical protein J416_09034 [Gracilibacillus halophilus YIM-C55.5]